MHVFLSFLAFFGRLNRVGFRLVNMTFELLAKLCFSDTVSKYLVFSQQCLALASIYWEILCMKFCLDLLFTVDND